MEKTMLTDLLAEAFDEKKARLNEVNIRKRFKDELDSNNIAYVSGILTAIDIIVSNNIPFNQVQGVLASSARDKTIWNKYLKYKGQSSGGKKSVGNKVEDKAEW